MARNRKAPEMRFVRTTTGTPYPLHPGDIGVVSVPAKVAKALLDSNQAIPVCGTHRGIVTAALCQAAVQLGVALKTDDAEIADAAKAYGAKLVASK